VADLSNVIGEGEGRKISQQFLPGEKNTCIRRIPFLFEETRFKKEGKEGRAADLKNPVSEENLRFVIGKKEGRSKGEKWKVKILEALKGGAWRRSGKKKRGTFVLVLL